MRSEIALLPWTTNNPPHLVAHCVRRFSILTVINGVYSPITAILRSGVMFQRPEGSKVDVLGPRIVYCTCHLAGLLFALYRVMLMGLIPLSVADYSGSIVGSRADGLVGVRTLF